MTEMANTLEELLQTIDNGEELDKILDEDDID